MDESAQTPDPRNPVGETPATEYAPPERRARRPWVIAAVVGVIVVIVGAIFGVKALAGGGSSSSASTASQGQAQGNRGRRGTIGMLQSIDGSTLTVATFNRGGGHTNGGGAGAAGGTTTVPPTVPTRFYKGAGGPLSDVKVGARVTARGTPAGDNAVTAERITDTGTMNAGFGGPGGGDG